MGHLTEHDTGKIVNKILGENEVESALQRLDRLTFKEAHATATQTLAVVHGLAQHMRIVVDGEATLSSMISISVLKVLHSRRKSIGGHDLGCAKYV